ncbi:AAA family ATPase [bacterium]|nr:AAA family ATPase [bacterium]
MRQLLELEQQEEKQLFLDRIGRFNVHERVKQGITWYPISIADWYFDSLDKLVIEIERVAHSDIPHEFNTGRIVSVFSNKENNAEARASGTIVSMRGNIAKVVMNCDDFEDWMKTGKVGMDLLYDETSFKEMKHALKALEKTENRRLQHLLDVVYSDKKPEQKAQHPIALPHLNSSQLAALNNCMAQQEIAIIHGPPGTGKTTTLLDVIEKSLETNAQILVTAPSNNAVDLLVEKLDQRGINVLRIGNPARINDHIQELSLSWQITRHADFSLIKKMKKQSAELRNMASKYKRNFGPSEREQRKALFNEAWKLQKDAQQIEDYISSDLLENAQVIATTLVASANQAIRDRRYPLCIIDEASQALEPASWIPIMRSEKVIMAGDHQQLPPTVKSFEADKAGLSKSLFETCMEKLKVDVMLTTQYRMNEQIMHFSSGKFYQNELQAHHSVARHSLDVESPVIEFVDTAGCSFDEETENKTNGTAGSLSNFHEADLLWKHFYALFQHLQNNSYPLEKLSVGLISPYKAQVELLKKQLAEFPFPKDKISINTIDGFQGQERDIIYISLVRSNDRNEIGFLKDYRRMNVALTRARKKLVVVGDSATIANDHFYNSFVAYAEAQGGYKTAWEFLY